MGGRNWLGFCTRVRKSLVLVWASKLTRCFVRVVEVVLFSVKGVELDLIWGQGWNWFGCCTGGRKQLDFSEGIGIDLLFVRRSKIPWLDFCVRDRNRPIFSVGIEIDLFFVHGGQNLLRFCVLAENTWFWCLDRNWLGFCMRDKNDLVLVWASKLSWFSCGWSKLTWFQCGGSNLT